MLQFKFLLWALALMLKRQARRNPDFARYIQTKRLVWQIRTVSGTGRYFVIENGAVQSHAGLTPHPQFTFCFRDGRSGFATLSAQDSQAAFLRSLGNKDLTVSGDFQEVMWFQGLTAFLQPPKVTAPLNRTEF